MTSWKIRLVAAGLCMLFVASDAAAWGPRARKSIAMAALQTIRREFDDAFRAGSSNYENDLLRGAEAGVDVIHESVPMNSDPQTVAAVSHQIQLLRTVSDEGTGSYFAYRMGALSTLVAEVVLPFGIPFNEEQAQLSREIAADIEARINSYSFAPSRNPFDYIASPRDYFSSLRQFYADDMRLIRDDYRRSTGYDGFLKEAGPSYFQRAIEGVIDAWYSVLRDEPGRNYTVPSPSIVTWYYVDEIGYLLNVKGNMQHAERAYRLFEEVNPGIMTAYERIGDLYYEYGTPAAKERAVREWRTARNSAGPQRARASRKLSDHYIAKGKRLLEKARGPEADETDLQDALRAFQSALEYEQSNDEAADYINETTVAIQKRQEKYETQQKIINKALEVVNQAEESGMDEDFQTAIFHYDMAKKLLNQAVTGDFQDLEETASDVQSQIERNMRDMVSTIIQKAERAIEEGDQLVEGKNFKQAIDKYGSVENLVEVIPGEEGTVNAIRKQELIERARDKIQEAREARDAWQQEQELISGGQPQGN